MRGDDFRVGTHYMLHAKRDPANRVDEWICTPKTCTSWMDEAVADPWIRAWSKETSHDR